MNSSSYRNKTAVPAANGAIAQMKNEIASELGVTMGPDATSRANGSVGGEMVRRMIKKQEEEMSSH